MLFRAKRRSAASYCLALAIVGWAALTGSSRAATLYGFAIDDSSEPKWTTGIDLVYGDGAVGSIARSWLGTDPDSAAAWVASIPEISGRESIIGSYLAVSMGGYGDQNDMLSRAIEASLSQGLNGGGFIDGDRGREGWPLAPGSSPEAVGMANGTLMIGNGRDGSYGSSWFLMETPDIVAIPEPSISLLGALSLLGLLRRRYVKA